MFFVAVVLMSVLATGNAEISEESCRISDEVLEDLLERGVSPEEVGQVHFSNGNALCFNETSQPSCCSAAMENVFEDQVEEFFRQKLVQLMTDLEDSIQNHINEFDQFVLFAIYGAHREVVARLRKTFGILLLGTVNEVNTMYLNMVEYFLEGGITGEEIVVSFLESLYTQLTQQLFGRSTKRYIGCTLTIMNKTYHPNFFTENLNFLKSAVARPILDFRAYSQSFRSLRKMFRRLKKMTITDECKRNIIWSTKCPFCLGLGQNMPPCPSLCTRVFEHCTHFSDGFFFDSLVMYIRAMSPIAQRMGLLDVVEVPVVIGNAVREFHSFWERRRLEVEESCGESLYNSPGADVPVREDQGDIPDFSAVSAYRTFAKTLRTMYVLNNITQRILNHDYFCKTSSPFSSPCWNGNYVSTSTVEHGSLIVASDAPREIKKEAIALIRFADKLRMVLTQGRDSFGPREEKSEPSSPLISEQEGQAGGSLGLSREITLKEPMNNRTNVKPGDRVVLRCAIAGDPLAVYQWFKDDLLLEEDERIVIRTFGWGSKLIISRVNPSDSGQYRCNGRNAYGERSTTGHLVVRIRECPHLWHRFGTSCYLMTSAMPFTSALEECTNTMDNAGLVSIQSVEENEFITSFVEREKAWIGAWKTTDGLLYWLNGDEWTFDAISQSQSHNSSCFATNDIGPGMWSPANCGKLKIAVCEVSLN